jgi:hypothetical protein
MRMNKRVGGLGLLAVVAVAVAPMTAANAQKISEKSVRTLMKYALSYTPDRFTGADGNTVHINRKGPEAIKRLMVPLVNAEQTVLAGRLAAHARVCGLVEEEKTTFISFLIREKRSKKWTPQQIVYLRSLFYTTEMLMVGKVRVVQRDDGGKKVVIREGKTAIKSCTDQQRKKIKALVTEYVAKGPDLSKVRGTTLRSPVNPQEGAAATKPN